MRINGAGSGAKAGQRGGFNAAVRGKAGAPDVPEAGFTESEPPIRFDAFFALALDKFMPEPERVLGFVKVGLFDDRSQDVKIVDFAEDVLKALEIVTPRDRKSTRLNSSHITISYAVFC